jgi:hypothetical protein
MQAAPTPGLQSSTFPSSQTRYLSGLVRTATFPRPPFILTDNRITLSLSIYSPFALPLAGTRNMRLSELKREAATVLFGFATRLGGLLFILYTQVHPFHCILSLVSWKFDFMIHPLVSSPLCYFFPQIMSLDTICIH